MALIGKELAIVIYEDVLAVLYLVTYELSCFWV